MDITRLDITILVSMTLGILLMSFWAPALGLTGTEAAESEVPEFNITSDRFDIVGDFPDRPGAPSQAYLDFEEELGGASDNQVWLQGDTNAGVELVLSHDTGASQPELTVNTWDSGSVTAQNESYLFNETGFVGHFDKTVNIGGNSYDWEIIFEAVEVNLIDGGANGSDSVVQYTIHQQPEDEQWYERVPVVGGIVSAGSDVAGTVGWIGSILLWFTLTIFEVILNMIGVMVDVLVFMFTLAQFLVGTYGDVVTGAPSNWAKVILLTPSVLVMVEFAKLGAVAVDIIWIG